jgi:hypothetical protein
MFLDHKFTALQLDIINKQAELYKCVCPIHVSMQIINLRKLKRPVWICQPKVMRKYKFIN